MITGYIILLSLFFFWNCFAQEFWHHLLVSTACLPRSPMQGEYSAPRKKTAKLVRTGPKQNSVFLRQVLLNLISSLSVCKQNKESGDKSLSECYLNLTFICFAQQYSAIGIKQTASMVCKLYSCMQKLMYTTVLC